MPAVEATLSTAPPPRATMPGRKAELSATTASTRIRTCSSSRAGSDSWKAPPVAKPALLTSTLTWRPSDWIRAGSRWREAALVRSQPSTSARTPWSVDSSVASSSSF